MIHVTAFVTRAATWCPHTRGNQEVAGRAAQARRQKLTAIRGESVGKRLTKGLNLPQ